MMKALFDFANQYIKTLKWQHFSMIKFCLISLGVLIGLLIPPEMTSAALVAAGIIFVITYIPVMAHFFKAWRNARK